MSQTILVIGATGTVGSLVVSGLLAQTPKPKVRVLTREKAKAQKFGDVEVIEGDYSDISKVTAGVQGADRVFLLTVSQRSQANEEKAIAEAAKAAGVKQIVKVSVYGASPAEPQSSLFRWHYDSENAVVATGVPTVILRPNLFLSNFARDDAPTIKAQGVFYKAQGDYRISHVDVRDIADVAVKVLGDEPSKHNGETYYITGPESLTFTEVAAIISEAIGKPVKVVTVDDAGLYGALTSKGYPVNVASFIVKLFQAYRTNNAATVQGDVKLVTGNEARSVKNYFTENKALFV